MVLIVIPIIFMMIVIMVVMIFYDENHSYFHDTSLWSGDSFSMIAIVAFICNNNDNHNSSDFPYLSLFMPDPNQLSPAGLLFGPRRSSNVR